MHYFSGFSLKNDESFFKDYIDNTAYTVAGFSFGAIKAFEFALSCKDRIDKLQLFSPAFFQNQTEDFKQMQLTQYQKNTKIYLKYFIQNCFRPHAIKAISQVDTTSKQLSELLWYQWQPDKLRKLTQKNIDIEVYLGEKDSIINTQEVKDFFIPFTTVYFIKNANHFLQLH